MWVLARVLGVAMVGAASLAGCGADQDEDEQQNLAVLQELPIYPGARELEANTSAYYGDEGGPFDRADGHTTSITYRVPDGTTQREVVRFFTSRLEWGWECEVERSGVVDLDEGPHPRRTEALLGLWCRSGRGSVSVNPDDLTTRASSFDVVADHRDSSS